MKLTKALALATFVAGSLLAGNTALQAQDNTNTPPAGAPPGGSGMRGRPDFAKDLNLTDDQKPKFKAIMQGAMEKQKALREDTSLSIEVKMKAIHEDTTTQIKALLTEEQFAKWQKHMQHNRPLGGPGAAGGNNTP